MKRNAVVVTLLVAACAMCMLCAACSSNKAGATPAAPASETTFASVSDKAQDTPTSQAQTASSEPASQGVVISLDRMREQTSALMKENERLKVTSNPYDFIKDGINPYYNEIVAMGPDAIPELKRELAESDRDGCEEYLFAIAIEEILNSQGQSALGGGDLPSSGKEYLKLLGDDPK